MTETGKVVPLAGVAEQEIRRSVYLDAYLAPFRPWLERESVTELLVNRPGELWVEDAAYSKMRRIELPEIDNLLLQRLAEQGARASHQGVNREHPLLAATLPGGERIQLCGPPATRGDWSMAIRRHRLLDIPLDAYDHGRLATPEARVAPDPIAEPIAFLKQAISRRQTILIAGGTSTGKTTFLNSMLREIPAEERVILVEDTAELKLPTANGVGLIAVRGELGESKVSTDELVQAALRLRPDRIVLGELRGKEVLGFLRAINTGHPGSFSTVHANTPRGALDQIALMAMQTGIGLTRTETVEYAASVIDVIVQLERHQGQRRIASIVSAKDAVGSSAGA
jgi:type IV secretion system protein VirB11